MSLELDFHGSGMKKNSSAKYIESCFSDLFSDAASEDLLISSENPDEISLLKNVSKKIQENFDNIILVGTGASYTIPKMMIDFGNRYQKNFIFLRNYDAESLNHIKNHLNPRKTAIISISKSGESLEIICNTLNLYDWLSSKVKDAAEHFYVITEEKPSKLFIFAESVQCTNLVHANVGGRFSVFTKVGLLPAMLAGFNVDLLLDEAKTALQSLIKTKKEDLIKAVTYQYDNLKRQNNIVLLSYGEKFCGFNQWVKQLNSESLGKDNKGFLTIDSIGSYDQHIQLQLFLDGNEKLFYKLVSASPTKNDIQISGNMQIPDIDAINKMTFSEHLNKNKELILTLLNENKKEILEYKLTEFNEKNISELITQHIMEIMLLGRALEINPFGQPAVENIKQKLEESVKNDPF